MTGNLTAPTPSSTGFAALLEPVSVIPLWRRPSLPVVGRTGVFPVRRIHCVGRNYAAHAREMGDDPERDPPFFFGKSADALVAGGGIVAYPPATADLQPEVELVIAISHGGKDLLLDDAQAHMFGYGVGIDLTRRDLQRQAKQGGRPWEAAKSFDQAAPCGSISAVEQVGHPVAGEIWLQVNGERRQQANLSDMIWSASEIVVQLSRLISLLPGDLIYTGTPAGVAPVVRGDRLQAGIEQLGTLDVTIV